MRPMRRQYVWVVFFVSLLFHTDIVRGQIWKSFIPSSRTPVDSDSHIVQTTAEEPTSPRTSQSTANADSPAGDFALTQQSGPWLIVAASFSGEGSEKQANALAQELRDRFHMRAYVHEMDFKFVDDAGDNSGKYGGSNRHHYRHGDEARELAVLIGDFPSIAGPDAKQALAKVKSLEPNALNVDAAQTTQSMAEVRRLEDAVLEKVGRPRKRGPMASAFFTRNPLLPQEYFVPKGVDSFVAKMNEGVENNLLDCPGRQTVQIATFRGRSILQTNMQEDPTTKSFFSTHKSDDRDPLVEAAENAHMLTKELRAHGIEAYEFHDRTESIVTIGSFASATQRLSDGRVVAIPEVQKIIQTFDASFDTPADPLSPIGNDSQNVRLVAERQHELISRLNGQQAQAVPGLNPKHVKILSGHGKNVKVQRIIPIDIHPKVIDVPRRSVSSAYAS